MASQRRFSHCKPALVWEETIIRLIAATAFAIAVATSAQAMPLAPLHQPEGMTTQVLYYGYGYRRYGYRPYGYRPYAYGYRRYGYYGYRPYGYGVARGVARRNIRRGVRRNW
jgi:hypothetical protein